jgi:hypothetical protein
MSGCGFDRRPGVFLLELGGTAVSERRVQAPVVALLDEARELIGDGSGIDDLTLRVAVATRPDLRSVAAQYSTVSL